MQGSTSQPDGNIICTFLAASVNRILVVYLSSLKNTNYFQLCYLVQLTLLFLMFFYSLGELNEIELKHSLDISPMWTRIQLPRSSWTPPCRGGEYPEHA